MIRPPRALGLVALLVAGLVRLGRRRRRRHDGSDTTEPSETTEASTTTEPSRPPRRSRRRKPVETTEAPGPPTPTPSLPPFEPEPIEWTSLGDATRGGRLEVPIDYANPDAGHVQPVPRPPPRRRPRRAHRLDARQPRRARIRRDRSSPSRPSSSTAQDLLDRFDIIGWDPRGTGESEPFIDCIDNYDEYYASTDITPDDDAERQQIIDLAEDFADQCVESNEDIIQFVGTNNSARDMDTIRRALGEDEISYFGFSYGSELGGTWATLFPDTVRAAVLDGAADPNADELEGSLQQTAGFEATLATFLAQCSDNPDCAFHNDGDAEGAFDQLMLKIDEKPLPTEPGRPLLTRGVALQGVAEAMYSDVLWADLEDGAGRRRSRATAPGCSPSTTRTTSASPTVRGTTRWRRSRRSTAWTRTSA